MGFVSVTLHFSKSRKSFIWCPNRTRLGKSNPCVPSSELENLPAHIMALLPCTFRRSHFFGSLLIQGNCDAMDDEENRAHPPPPPTLTLSPPVFYRTKQLFCRPCFWELYTWSFLSYVFCISFYSMLQVHEDPSVFSALVKFSSSVLQARRAKNWILAVQPRKRTTDAHNRRCYPLLDCTIQSSNTNARHVTEVRRMSTNVPVQLMPGTAITFLGDSFHPLSPAPPGKKGVVGVILADFLTMPHRGGCVSSTFQGNHPRGSW